nr:type II toxin-antitoxin system death-on-curing family toxin [Sulfobacillus thermosulfidooxidans]
MQRYVIDVTEIGRMGDKYPAYLEAALARPSQAGFGQEFYPTVADKIAVLIHSSTTTHAFEDANKRTAMALGLAVAEANGQRIQPIDDREIKDIASGIAIHTYDVGDIVKWLTLHYQF